MAIRPQISGTIAIIPYKACLQNTQYLKHAEFTDNIIEFLFRIVKKNLALINSEC